MSFISLSLPHSLKEVFVLLKEYFSVAVGICVFIAVASALCHAKMKTATAFGAGVLVICAVILPLRDLSLNVDAEEILDKFGAEFEYGEKTDGAIELAFEDGIAEYVAAKYGVGKTCVFVAADGFDMERLRAERIYVTLSEDGTRLDYRKIEDDIRDRFTNGGECEVTLNVG